MKVNSIKPVILCGGSGTRLWPLSTQEFPKPFIPILNNKSLFQHTLDRVSLINSKILFVTNEEYRFFILENLHHLNSDAELILESESKNTAASILLAAMQSDPNELLLICPADHYIENNKDFYEAIELGVPAADEGRIVVFGIKPTYPATGYGYIETEKNAEIFNFIQFIEKPSLVEAEKIYGNENFFWNAGFFLIKASSIIKLFAFYAPEVLDSIEKSMNHASVENFSYNKKIYKFIRPEKVFFSKCKNESFDYLILEKNPEIFFVPFLGKWSDIGSWDSYYEVFSKDKSGNVINGNVLTLNTKNSLIYSTNRLILASGVDNLCIIDTQDALLISNRNDIQHLKELVYKVSLTKKNTPRLVWRPWGFFETIDVEDKFKVKKITIKPGASISLQRHKERSEHWVVVLGEADIVIGEKKLKLSINQSIYIPRGVIHKLSNFASSNLIIVEVQVGDYLNEEDIERIDDSYGRK